MRNRLLGGEAGASKYVGGGGDAGLCRLSMTEGVVVGGLWKS